MSAWLRWKAWVAISTRAARFNQFLWLIDVLFVHRVTTVRGKPQLINCAIVCMWCQGHFIEVNFIARNFQKYNANTINADSIHITWHSIQMRIKCTSSVNTPLHLPLNWQWAEVWLPPHFKQATVPNCACLEDIVQSFWTLLTVGPPPLACRSFW